MQSTARTPPHLPGTCRTCRRGAPHARPADDLAASPASPALSTITVARKGAHLAIAADALTTFDETRLPPEDDAAPDKILPVETPLGTAYIGSVGFTAHHLVLQDALERMPDADLLSRRGIFDTFRRLHPILQEDYYLLPESGEDGDPYESSQVSLLVAAPTGIFGVYDMREVHEFSRYWAMGSGFAFALGAMHARYDSASAEELAALGVDAGCTFDRSSAPPVQTFTLPLVEAPPPAPAAPRPASPARRRGGRRRER